MNSNVGFESNVYPVVGSVKDDKEFLSRIWDYNRISVLDKRYMGTIRWSKIQAQILAEKPTCAWNKEDPCWGMVKTANGHTWISMCTKTQCREFEKCRLDRPYNPTVETEFIPTENFVRDEYGYDAFLGEYSAYPVLVGEQVEYEIEELTTANNKEAVSISDITFTDLISAEDIVDSSDIDVQEPLLEEKIPSTTGEITDEVEETEVLGVKDVAIDDPNINVFEFFVSGTQEEIINASSKECFFVDAGPGTGKTYTLIQKLNHLVCKEGVEADGILVLCFTNAAVDEVKMRLRQFVSSGADRSLVNVDVRTFHSFAWWLINQANSVLKDSGWHPVNMHTLSYEKSLKCAGDIVSRFGEQVVGNWEYFIVDEVQDLTNMLGRFVLKIVGACLTVGCGVTVFGDACQAIYDYEQSVFSMKSDAFYKELFRKLYGKAQCLFLSENHRQGPDLIELTSGLRTAILSDDTDQMKQAVSKFLNDVEISSATGAAITETYLDGLRNDGSVSLLFRDNGHTLKMSSDLRKRGITHTLNVSETGNNFATWISDVFREYRKPTISEDKFVDLYEDVTDGDGVEVWRRLQKLLHTDNDVLDVKTLLNAIAVSKIDDPVLRSVKERKIVVSNIHRSKGREFDCVLVDKSFVESFSEKKSAGEYKTLYVAITRPRKRVIVAPLQSKSMIEPLLIFSTGRKRWGAKKNKKITYFELDSAKDIGCDCYVTASPSVFDEIAIGDEIYLKRKITAKGVEYLIIHENSETCIGSIPEHSNYVQDLMAYMKIDRSSLIELPSVISDIYVSGVFSQVVDEKYMELHPSVKEAVPNGVWKWVDLVGIGHAEYDVY